MIVRWKLEMAGSKDTVSGSVEIDDDEEDPAPDDYIDEVVQEAVKEFLQITWEKIP